MSDIRKPFRITIEHYDKKYTIETDHSDVSMDELWEMLQQIVLAAGFSPETVKEYFND